MKDGDIVDIGLGPMEVISSYSDEQAVEDGMLADISGLRVSFQDLPVARMTSALFEAIRPFIITFCPEHDGPTGDILTGKDGFDGECQACARSFNKELAHMLRTKLSYAKDTAEEGEPPNYLFELPGGGEDNAIWLIRNGELGWTIMYASDY